MNELGLFHHWPRGAKDGFAFVLNPFQTTASLPIELMPGARLDKADSSQTEVIEELRQKLGRTGESIAFLHEPISKEVRESAEWDRILPPRSTFWVVKFDINPGAVVQFSYASQLTENEMEIGAVFPPKEQTFIPRVIFPWRMESFFDHSWRNDAQPLNRDELTTAHTLADTIQSFRQVDEPAINLVLRVFDDFIDLSQQHRSGHLALLGHFALIEALITHNPAESRNLLSHQVRTKMPLLMRRFRRPLVVSDYFSMMDAQKAWHSLYRVRSSYAHGGEPDFDADGIKELEGLYEIFQFVRESLKRLLILALDEPQLIFDLKSC